MLPRLRTWFLFALAATTACSHSRRTNTPRLRGTPDAGGRLAIALQAPSGSSHVFLVQGDRREFTRVPGSDAASDGSPRFSRDGGRLAFVRQGAALCLLDLKTEQVSVLPVQGTSPSFSPAGDRLCYIGTDKTLHVFDFEAHSATPLPWSRGLRVAAVEWSPTEDVLLVALEGDRAATGAGLELGVFPLETGAPRMLGQWLHDARWSPDGRLVFGAAGVLDLSRRTVVPISGSVPLAWSSNGLGFLGLADDSYGIFDFAGNLFEKLTLPAGYTPPRIVDYGFFGADWSIAN
jgi:hypothetical protein